MKVLIVEDDSDVVESLAICFELRWEGTTVISANRGEGGIKLVRTDSPDVVILDLGLPDMDGLDVLRHIREFSNVPIVILTARHEETDKVKGLKLGADDYVSKPFSPTELLNRVKAVIRRSSISEEPKNGEKPFVNGRLKLNFASREVFIENRPIKLTANEYRLLCELVINKGKVLSNQMLLERVWGPEYTGDTLHVNVCTQGLKEKLEEEPNNPKMILREPGIGYKLI